MFEVFQEVLCFPEKCYILPTSPVFKKNDIGWPQQPLTEKVSDISEKMDFL